MKRRSLRSARRAKYDLGRYDDCRRLLVNSMFATTPLPPYYAVIFSSHRGDGDRGYAQMAERMMELAAQQPGFLGVESARGADGFGITVSYWKSEEAIAAWKAHAEHKPAQEGG